MNSPRPRFPSCSTRCSSARCATDSTRCGRREATSLLTVGFIKAEVILSYLGLGVRVDQVSWGTMLAEAQSELILGHWWQLAAATLFMAVFVTAFSLMADAVRDALDPKLRGLE